MVIGVILPSRGLLFSRTADEILRNLAPYRHKFFFAHKRPIPECFEEPVNRALLDESITHLWLVEEDMIIPENTLDHMIDMGVAVVTVDYPTTKNGKGAVFEVKKQVVFCGTGCTLIQREVFDELRAPYFTSDVVWNIKNYGDFIKLKGIKRGGVKDGYGLHDVNFCMKLWGRKIPIHKLPYTIGQRRLINLGKAGSNDGAHNIEDWTKVKKDYLLKQVKSWPIQPKGNLVSLMTPTGEILVSQAHAKKLITKKLASRMPRKAIVVDDSEVL